MPQNKLCNITETHWNINFYFINKDDKNNDEYAVAVTVNCRVSEWVRACVCVSEREREIDFLFYNQEWWNKYIVSFSQTEGCEYCSGLPQLLLVSVLICTMDFVHCAATPINEYH